MRIMQIKSISITPAQAQTKVDLISTLELCGTDEERKSTSFLAKGVVESFLFTFLRKKSK